MAKNYVCDGAKIECQLCTKPEGTLMVTSNQIKVQDKIVATAKDKEKVNLIFEGNCKKSTFQMTPCIAVIKLEKWKNTADLKVQGSEALLENSTIMCAYGGIPIKITDHLQVNEPTEIQPTDAPVIAPVEDATVTSMEWMSNKSTEDSKSVKTLHQHDQTDKAVTEESEEEKLWLEITTQNILPGQKVTITLEDENDSNGEPIALSAIVDDREKATILLNSEKEEEQVNEGREERRTNQKAKENELTPAQKRAWNKAINPLPPGPKW